MKMTGAEVVMKILLEHGVDTVFGYPGGTALGVGPPAPIPVLLRIEFTASDSLQPMGELLPRLSTLTDRATLCR